MFLYDKGSSLNYQFQIGVCGNQTHYVESWQNACYSHPQTQAAIVTRVVDFGLSPHDAVAAPRWLYGRSWGLPANNLKLEGRFAPQVAESLSQKGHSVERLADFSDLMGHAGAILCDHGSGLLFGATDPRSDGLAAGY